MRILDDKNTYIIQIGEDDNNMIEMKLTSTELEKFVEFAEKMARQTNNKVLCAVSNRYDDTEHFTNVFKWEDVQQNESV